MRDDVGINCKVTWWENTISLLRTMKTCHVENHYIGKYPSCFSSLSQNQHSMDQLSFCTKTRKTFKICLTYLILLCLLSDIILISFGYDKIAIIICSHIKTGNYLKSSSIPFKQTLYYLIKFIEWK